MKKEIQEAFKASIPVFMGYVVLGIAFGMLLVSKGYRWYWALFSSVVVYAGSMQFVMINLLTSGASMISTAIMTFLINARHLVYGLSMLGKYENMGKLKPYMIFSLTDETYSLLVSPAPEGVNEKYYYFFVSIFDQCYWVLGSVIGGVMGSLITINTAGLDFAMTALFIVIVTEQFLTSTRHIYSYIGFALSIVSLLILGKDNFLIPAIIGIIAGLSFMYIKGDEGNA